MAKYILALDQGTTSSRAIVFDEAQNVVAVAQQAFNQYYPQPGYVEHDATEIYASQFGVLAEVVAKSGVKHSDIVAIGIANQRETTVVWDKKTGVPVFNALVWQCRRTAPICEEIKKTPLAQYIQENTGLIVDAYFSATKLKWILDNVPGVRERAQAGELLFGTVDTWLIWKLTDGRVHVTDYTNASRTMMYNIKTLEWDQHILDELDIPKCMLPQVKNSSGVYGYLTLRDTDIPIAGIAGDQQSALFGQACFSAGEAKNTYGTGCFVLMNTGDVQYHSNNGMLSTIAIGLNDKVEYAIEGSIFVGGAVVQWLRDELRLLYDAKDSGYFAAKVEDSNGVYVVPAFTGLGAPYWDMYARGAILGLTRGANRNHIIRAALEAIAYQSKDVLDAISKDTGINLCALKVDGGASQNDFLMQFQSDLLNCPVLRPKITETTALGCAFLAGLGVGVWKDKNDIRKSLSIDKQFVPAMSEDRRVKLYAGWQKAVRHVRGWEEQGG